MANSYLKDGISYELLSPLNLAGAVKCVSEVFTQSEPLVTHLGINLKEFQAFAHAHYSTLVNDGLSWIAKLPDTEEVIGVRISEDYERATSPLDLKATFSSKFIPLLTLLEHLGNYFRAHHEIRPGQYVHLFMVAVKQRFMGQGVAQTMNKLFFKYIKQMGFTHAVTEPTGSISQYVLLHKFGFRTLHEISYDDFVYQNRKPFENLKGHRGAMLMEKKLSELLL